MRLARSILQCFADLPAPNLATLDSCDQRPETLEAQNVRKFFAGKLWQDVNSKLIEAYPGDRTACMEFMDNQAFHYYFPGFLLVCLDDVMDDFELLEPTARFLDLGSAPRNRRATVVNSYALQQKRCIAEWLLTVSGRFDVLYRHEADRSLHQLFDDYWRVYLITA